MIGFIPALVFALAFAAVPAFADEHGIASAGPIEVHHAMSPATPGPAKTAAIYLEIVNTGDARDRLIGVDTDAAARSTIHRTIVENDIAKMRPATDGVGIAARGYTALTPGGYHVMLTGLTEKPEVGDYIELILEFENAGELTVMVPVVDREDVMGHEHGNGHHGRRNHGRVKHGEGSVD